MDCTELLQKIEAYDSNFNPDQVIKAFEFSKKAHEKKYKCG